MGAVADRVTDVTAIPYSEIPEFCQSSVVGHAGRLLIGELGGATVAVMQGRLHYYEGHTLAQVTLPIRVLAAIGARVLILTAATGGIRADLRAGNIVCVSDHINMLGDNPLRGIADDRLGPRFPDLSEAYSRRLREVAHATARGLGIALTDGVYAAMPGPSYETPAEIRMLRTLGADVVGMSTVPEAIVARQAGMEVLALALVTNAAAGLGTTPITHEEVLAAGRAAEATMCRLLEAVVERLAAQ